jgi:hypothetical protein
MMLSGQNLTKPNIEGYFGASVNSYSGNLFYKRTDLFIPCHGLALVIRFSYNSGRTSSDYGFGYGWTMNYNLFYELSGNSVIFNTDDGDKHVFVWNGSGYTPPAGVFSELTEYLPGKFLLRNKYGTKFYFDSSTHKKLTKIEDRNGNAITLLYSGSKLLSVTDPCGKTLNLTMMQTTTWYRLPTCRGRPTVSLLISTTVVGI